MALKDVITSVVDSATELFSPDDATKTKKQIEAQKKSQSGEDAIEILKADHRKVEALFKEILAEKSSLLVSQRKNIALVIAELTLHAKVEEKIFYPAVYGETKRDSDERLEVLEAFEEHGAMKDLIKKIQRSTGRDESLKAKVQVLSEITEHHVKEEESEFFPDAKKILGEKRLKELGADIANLKARSTGKPTQKTRRTGAKKTSPKVTSRKSAAK